MRPSFSPASFHAGLPGGFIDLQDVVPAEVDAGPAPGRRGEVTSRTSRVVSSLLLFGLFGWKIAALYLGTGLVVAMIAGWTIGRLGMEKHVESWVYQAVGIGGEGAEEEAMSIADRIRYGYEAVCDIVGKVWVYVVLGIAVGAGIHGYVPENFLASPEIEARIVVPLRSDYI